MSDNTLLQKRSLQINDVTTNGSGDIVVYVMSRDQRFEGNHALLVAQEYALQHRKPLIAVFNVYPSTGVRARQHYDFMLEGLEEVEAVFEKHSIPLLFFHEKTQVKARQKINKQKSRINLATLVER